MSRCSSHQKWSNHYHKKPLFETLSQLEVERSVRLPAGSPGSVWFGVAGIPVLGTASETWSQLTFGRSVELPDHSPGSVSLALADMPALAVAEPTVPGFVVADTAASKV